MKKELKYGWNLLIRHNPLYEWIKINHDLNNIYPEYNIFDDEYGLNVKNSSRHFTGGALGKLFYGETLTNKLGNTKEKLDKITHKDALDLDDDIKTDFLNNSRGIQYARENPYATRKDVYNAAIQNAIKNYAKDYLNKGQKEVNGKIIKDAYINVLDKYKE